MKLDEIHRPAWHELDNDRFEEEEQRFNEIYGQLMDFTDRDEKVVARFTKKTGFFAITKSARSSSDHIPEKDVHKYSGSKESDRFVFVDLTTNSAETEAMVGLEVYETWKLSQYPISTGLNKKNVNVPKAIEFLLKRFKSRSDDRYTKSGILHACDWIEKQTGKKEPELDIIRKSITGKQPTKE